MTIPVSSIMKISNERGSSAVQKNSLTSMIAAFWMAKIMVSTKRVAVNISFVLISFASPVAEHYAAPMAPKLTDIAGKINFV